MLLTSDVLRDTAKRLHSDSTQTLSPVVCALISPGAPRRPQALRGGRRMYPPPTQGTRSGMSLTLLPGMAADPFASYTHGGGGTEPRGRPVPSEPSAHTS